MKFIPLTNSRFSAIVDDEDYIRVMALNTDWCVIYDKDKNPASIGSTRKINNKYILLGRFIMNCIYDNGLMNVDHIFDNIFDNRKVFLRMVTFSQNCMNTGKYRNNKSGVKGIYWNKANKNWCSQITKEGRRITVGSFLLLEDAIKARKEAEEKHFGEFSRKS